MAVKRSNSPPVEVTRSFCTEGYKNTRGAHPVEKQVKEFLKKRYDNEREARLVAAGG